jgi:hypothetical protein
MAETKTGAERKSGSRKAKAESQPAAPPPREEAQAATAREHVCNVAFCPIGLALSTVQGAAPDVLEHLLKAAQEFLLATRAVIDNRARDFEGEPADASLQRIEIS